MSKKQDISLFPVTGWEISDIPAYGALMLSLPFLSSPMQSADKPNPGRNYFLTYQQAAELADAIQRALRRAQNTAPPPIPPDLVQ